MEAGGTNVLAPSSLPTRHGTLGYSCSQEVDAIEKGESELKLFENDLHRLENGNNGNFMQVHHGRCWREEKSHL